MAGSAPGIYLGMLAGSPPVRLTPDVGNLAYLSPGWLLWTRTGTLFAQRLDLDKRALVGEVATAADNVDVLSTSANGLVAYRGAVGAGLQLNWRDRSGKLLGTVGESGLRYDAPAVSPDGRRVAVGLFAQTKSDIWILDGARSSRITFEGTQFFPALVGRRQAHRASIRSARFE